MLTKDVAKKLNYPLNVTEFNEALTAYATLRMEQLKEAMAVLNDPSELPRLQGQYREAKKLLTLRDEVEDVKKS